MKEEVFSFDIFDTLITRTVAEPYGIFLNVQNKPKDFDIPEFIKNNFMQIRQEAESFCTGRALSQNGKFDCTLNEIYENIKKNYLLNDEIIEKLKQTEIEEEIKNTFPIIENINKVKELKKQNKKVILTSDMYLPSDVLKAMLIKADSVFEDIEIFVSSETGKRKSNGTLYKFIQNKYKIINHYGDNEFSDITQAKWNGIKPVKITPEKLKPYEKNLLQKHSFNEFIQKSIGISKALRQNNKGNKVFDFAVSFAAPILYCYVDWILKEAINREIKDLYFVARDGFVPKIIADIIITTKNYDIKTHYFYGSRRASRFADENNINEYINQVFSELKSLQTEEFIAKRFNITVDELKSFGEPRKDNLISNDSFKELVICRQKQKKELFLKYIKQEVDFSRKFGFVDLNGSGRTQDFMVKLINNNICDCTIDSFYFKLQADMEYCDKSNKSAYINSLNYNNLFLELLCRTLHGQTLEYQEKEGKIHPVLEYETNDKMQKWGFEQYVEGIKKYSEIMSDNNCANTTILCLEYMKYLKGITDKETADVIGTIPFALFGDELKVKEFIPAYNIFNLFTLKTPFGNLSASRANFLIKKLSVILNIKNIGYISKKQKIAYLKIGKYKINIGKYLFKDS